MENIWLRVKNEELLKKATIRLFCFPYAGAGASVYLSWRQYFDSNNIIVCPISLPGRENRIRENLIDNVVEIIDKVYEAIKDYLDKPYAILGHSMGGILAYELTKKIESENGRKPLILFLSATALTLPNRDIPIHQLDEDMFAQHILKLGGTYSELLYNEEFRECYFPIIRNDYKIAEEYKCDYKKICTPICAFASKDDKEMKFEETLKISTLTEDFFLYEFSGGHFFINDSEEKVCQLVKQVLAKRYADQGGDVL